MLRPSTVAVRPTWLKRNERAGSQVRRVPAVRRRRVGKGGMVGGVKGGGGRSGWKVERERKGEG